MAKLERINAPAQSPFERDYRSVNGFAAEISAGALDPRGGPLVLNAVERWHRDRVWDLWQ